MMIQTKLKVSCEINSIFIMNKESCGHPLSPQSTFRGGGPGLGNTPRTLAQQ